MFSGTFTTGGLELRSGDGTLPIAKEGGTRSSSAAIEQVCYKAEFAEREGRTAIFVRERAVFRAVEGTLELIEVAPGIDIDRDILPNMAFRPKISRRLTRMDTRLFHGEPMGLLADIEEARRNYPNYTRPSGGRVNVATVRAGRAVGAALSGPAAPVQPQRSARLGGSTTFPVCA